MRTENRRGQRQRKVVSARLANDRSHIGERTLYAHFGASVARITVAGPVGQRVPHAEALLIHPCHETDGGSTGDEVGDGAIDLFAPLDVEKRRTAQRDPREEPAEMTAQRDAVFINPEDASRLHLRNRDPVALVNNLGRFQGRIFIAPIAAGNLQIHWPEGNVLIRRGVTDPGGGVPDYNMRVTVEKI